MKEGHNGKKAGQKYFCLIIMLPMPGCYKSLLVGRKRLEISVVSAFRHCLAIIIWDVVKLQYFYGVRQTWGFITIEIKCGRYWNYLYCIFFFNDTINPWPTRCLQIDIWCYGKGIPHFSISVVIYYN